MAKDLFSGHSKEYALYRPSYPDELYEYILQHVYERKRAWDCATGNGQAAVVLATNFTQVFASDISEAQINNAVARPNIEYFVCPAEQTPFNENSFDLITVAQAYHWINWKKFHEEALRVGKPGALVAIWTYNLLATDDERINDLVTHFYKEIVGPFWEYERRFVDDAYETVDFNFASQSRKTFRSELMWTRNQFVGYLNTWSAVHNYIKVQGSSPVLLIQSRLEELLQQEVKPISFPIFLRLGRIEK